MLVATVLKKSFSRKSDHLTLGSVFENRPRSEPGWENMLLGNLAFRTVVNTF